MTGIDLYGTLQAQQTLEAELLLSASTGATDNYEQLKNRPSINGVVLSGDKSSEDLFLASAEALAAEKEERENADNSLSERIDAEVTAREKADNVLLQKIDATALTASAQGESLTFTDAADNCGLYSLYIEGKSVQNGTPTPDNPIEIDSIGNSGSLSVTACGKNLFDNSLLIKKTDDNKYTEMTADVRIHFVNSAGDFFRVEASVELPAGEYVFFRTVETISGVAMIAININGGGNDYNDKDFTLTEKGRVTVTLTTSNQTTIGEYYCNIVLIKKGSSTTYEPYKGNKATITSALPLCSVGDVRDEVIFNADGTAKVIKRTAKIKSYSSENVGETYISSTGTLTTGATVVYPLATPEEINLTADETATLLALSTYEGTTNLFNSDNASMTAKYWRNEAVGSLLTSISRSTNSRLTALENAIIGG